MDYWKKAYLFNEGIYNYPEKIHFQDRSFSYSANDIVRISGQVFRYLSDSNIGKEDVVMIHMKRGGIVPCIFYGILRAGACAVIVTEDANEHFFNYFFNDCQPKVVINQALFDQIIKLEPKNGWREPDEHDAAFIVYTTSSTGDPKGCIHEYGDIDLYYNHVSSCRDFGDLSTERYCMTEGMYDISSYADMLEVPITGEFTYIAPDEVRQSTEKIAELIRSQKLTSVCLNARHADWSKLKGIKSLRYVIVAFEISGDVYQEEFPIFNEYGMSESILAAAHCVIDGRYEIAPVGIPNKQRGTVLLSKNGSVISEPNVVGEIAFPNPFFRGYLNKPDETKKAIYDGLYHTHDMAYYDESGMLFVIGRSDDVVIRQEEVIATSYIIAKLKAIDASREYAVRVFDIDSLRIVVFYTGDSTIDAASMNDRLRQMLKDIMLPTDYIHLDKLLETTSGKLDRVGLGKMVMNREVSIKD